MKQDFNLYTKIQSININILECKSNYKYKSSIYKNSININILECKLWLV